MCLSKGLTGGMLALGATSATDEIFDVPQRRSAEDVLPRPLFRGQPLACAVARASLRTHEGAGDLGEHPTDRIGSPGVRAAVKVIANGSLTAGGGYHAGFRGDDSIGGEQGLFPWCVTVLSRVTRLQRAPQALGQHGLLTPSLLHFRGTTGAPLRRSLGRSEPALKTMHRFQTRILRGRVSSAQTRLGITCLRTR